MMCKRKLTSGLAAAAMLVAIAGCGGAKPASSGATAPGTAPLTSVNEPTSQPPTAPTAVPNGPGPATATAPASTPPAGGTNSQPVAPTSQPVSQPPAQVTPPAAQPAAPANQSVNQPPAQPATPAPQPAAPVKPVAPTPPAPPVTAPPPSQSSGDLAFTTIARGQQSSGRDRHAMLVSSEASLNAQGLRPTQAVDFSQEAVLVVYMGEQNTGGYSIEITSVKLEGGKLLVTVKQSRPSPNAMVTQALTQPYHAVKIPNVPAGTQVSVNWL